MNELQQTINELRHYCSGYQLELLQEIERLTQGEDMHHEIADYFLRNTSDGPLDAGWHARDLLSRYTIIRKIEDEPCECGMDH